MVSVPSPFLAELGLEDELLSLDALSLLLLLSLPLPQAVSASEAEASTMAERQARVGRVNGASVMGSVRGVPPQERTPRFLLE
jgi:hypothetical protein